MICRFLLLLLRFPLFSAVSSAAVALAATGQTLYPIESGQRGTQIINTFGFFSSSIAATATFPYVAIQTTLSPSNYTTYKNITNGIIPYVQSITPTMFNTLLIVTYLPPSGTQQQSNPQFVVLPSDQTTTLLYFTQAPKAHFECCLYLHT